MNENLTKVSLLQTQMDTKESMRAQIYIFPQLPPHLPASTRIDMPCLSLSVVINDEDGEGTSFPLKQTPSRLWKREDLVEIPSNIKSATLRVYTMEKSQQKEVLLGQGTLKRADLPLPAQEKVVQVEFTLARSFPNLGVLGGIVAFAEEGQHERVSNDIEGFMFKFLNDKSFMLETAMALPAHPMQIDMLLYLGRDFRENFEKTQDNRDIQNSISAFTKAASVVLPDNPQFEEIMLSWASSCVTDCKTSGSVDNLNHVISSLEATVEGVTSNNRQIQTTLAHCLASRFDHTNEESDIERAISLQNQATEVCSEGAPEKPALSNKLGLMLSKRFRRTKDLKYSDYSILAHREALSLLASGSPERPGLLFNLGGAFGERFTTSRDINDIDEAIIAYQEAVDLIETMEATSPESLSADPPIGPSDILDKGAVMRNLASSIYRRWELGNKQDIQDVQQGILWFQKSLDAAAFGGHSPSPEILVRLGTLLLQRFHGLGNLKDIDDAISAFRRAVSLTPTNDQERIPERLASLANTLRFRFEQTGTASDIDDSVEAVRGSLNAMGVDDSQKSSNLDILGSTLLRRFLSFGDANALSEAITAFESSIKLTPASIGEVHMGSRLSHLGNALLRRFELLGNENDIDKAMSVQPNAVRLTSDADREAYINYNNLGNACLRRFIFRTDRRDIEEAVFAFQKAVQLSKDYPNSLPPLLDNFSSALRIRGNIVGNIQDLDTAISIQQRASTLLPSGHMKTPELLANLGRAYLDRFVFSNDRRDVTKAISIQRKALNALPEKHIGKVVATRDHAETYVKLFSITQDVNVIDCAISLYREAIDCLPSGHSELANVRGFLAEALRLRFESTGDDETRESAITEYRLASLDTHGMPFVRLDVSHRMALFFRTFDPLKSLEGYRHSLELLQRVAWIGASVNDRHQKLRRLSQIPIEAATVALSLGEHAVALEWLEYGRCVVWSQLNHLRTPLDDFRELHPKLADEMMRVSAMLDKSSTLTSQWSSDNNMGSKILIENESRMRHQLADEWEVLLERARALHGFEDFLRAPRLSQLLHLTPTSGPVVVINMHPTRCDALVLMSGAEDCVHIPLQHFSHQRANILRESLASSLGSNGLRTREDRKGRTAKNPRAENTGTFMKLLAELWVCVVNPILEGLAYSPTLNPSRIWWCPTGPLAFLPIHAAGIYGINIPFGSAVSDYVVSSYTPSVGALVTERHRKKDLKFGGILAVSQPNAPNLAPIPNTTKEVEDVRNTFGRAGLDVEILEGSAATVESVMSAMESRSWIHFACHALQNIYQPTQSAFYLHDGPLELSTVMKKPLPKADFAFLSACQTGTGDENLSEEAVHLAAGMLSAGYRSVIATTWCIDDRYCPIIAQEVYSRLLEDRHQDPDSSMAAYALHHATQKLRREIGDSENSLLSWVPFVHIGV